MVNFARQSLKQTNGIGIRAVNSWFHSDLAIQSIDNAIEEAKSTHFKEIHCFGQYMDDCSTIRTGKKDKFQELLKFFNCFDSSLWSSQSK